MPYVERATQRRCTCFKFQVSSFKFQVSSFKFQVSSFSFQVSSFRFQVWSWFLKLYLNLYLNLYLLSLRTKSRTIEKILHRATRSFFWYALCWESYTEALHLFQVSSFKFEVDLWSCSWTCSKCQIERSRDFIIIYKFNFARRDKN